MSIIVKKVFPPKGQAPGDVTIISKIAYGTKAYIKWSDPANTVSNGVTVATWGGTLLLRKTGSYPTSITDGTVVVNNTTRDKYKSTDFVDSGLTNGTTYYYRFFTYDNGILRSYNTNTSMQFTLTCYNASATLSENSWSTIAAISESGNASSLWNIGDEIEITLKSNYYYDKESITLQIWDFNHFDKTDGSGKAGITFGSKLTLQEKLKMDTYSPGNYWSGTEMHMFRIQNTIEGRMSDDIASVIKEVNTYQQYNDSSSDKIFIPSYTEFLGNRGGLVSGQELNCSRFPIFTTDESLSIIIDNFDKTYWTRSTDEYNLAGGKHFFAIRYSTNRKRLYIDSSMYSNEESVRFCFNV